MSFDYEPLDISAIAQESQLINDDSGSTGKSKYLETYVRLPQEEGFVLVRFLPGKKGQKFFWAETRTHSLTNPSIADPMFRRRTFHCRNTRIEGTKKYSGDCIICKYYQKLWRDSDAARSEKEKEELQSAARAIKPTERYYYNCIVRSEKDFNSGETKKNVGPKIYSCGVQVYGKIVRSITGDEKLGEPRLGDVTHPKTGRDFRIVKKIKASGTRDFPNYDLSKFEESSVVGTADEFRQWMDNLHDLQALRVIKSNEELTTALKVHLGQIREGGDDDSLSEIVNNSKVSSNVKDHVTERPAKQEVASKPAKVEAIEGNMDDLADLVGNDDFMKELSGM